MAIEIVDFPMKNGGSFHSYVNVYQAGYPLNETTVRSLWKSRVDITSHILGEHAPTNFWVTEGTRVSTHTIFSVQVLMIEVVNPDFFNSMGDLQDPKMEVLYHIRPYFAGIIPYIGLT